MAKTPGRQKARPKKETPDSFPVVYPGQLPYQSTSQRTRQVHILQSSRQVSIDHVAIRATQYEFYFPIAVWHLDATRTFLANLSQFAGGATIFKGATGVWREEKKDERQEDRTVEEDVYIYRLIVNTEQFNPNTVYRSITTDSLKVFSNGGTGRCSGRFLRNLDIFTLITRGLIRLRRITPSVRSRLTSHNSP